MVAKLVAHRCILFEKPLGKLANCRSVTLLDRQRLGHRRLTRLHPGDDERRALPGLLGAEHAVPTHRDPFRSVGPARLRDIDLAAGRIDPRPEAGELPVPEHGVLLDGELVDHAVRERPILKRCHALLLLCSGGFGDPSREMRADALAHACRRDLLRIAHQVRVTRRRRHLAMPEQLPDGG